MTQPFYSTLALCLRQRDFFHKHIFVVDLFSFWGDLLASNLNLMWTKTQQHVPRLVCCSLIRVPIETLGCDYFQEILD